MSNLTFNFGKHKGKTVQEVISTDPQYIEWALGQAWFSERNPQIHQYIINAGAEPDHTPAHNRLQALFLKQEYREAFHKVISDREANITLRHKERRRDEHIHLKDITLGNPEFEPVDVRIPFDGIDWHQLNISSNARSTIDIEIKPTIGDDYPAIIRQIKNKNKFDLMSDYVTARINVLFVDDFTASGVTKEEMEAMFAASNIQVVWKKDVDDLLSI